MNNSELVIAVAKDSLQKLLSELSVGQVVVIDDFFEKDFDHETVVGWLANPEINIPDVIIKKLDEIDFSNPEVLKMQFVGLWDNLDGNQKKDLALFVSENLGKSLESDRKIDQNLTALFGDKITCLSPSEWMERKGEYFQKTNYKEKLFCIFDQDLSLSKGFTAEGSTSGVGLIQDVKGNLPDISICCLLTHTIPSIDQEMERWRILSSSVGLELREFIPLAKVRLANDNSPSIFVDGIKKAALNRYFEDLKRVTENIIQESNLSAIKNFLEIDPYDFDAIVLKSSKTEGSWEVDALLRIYQIIHKDHILEGFFNPETLLKIKDNVLNARKISSVPLDGVVNNYPQLRPLRKKELFQAAALLSHSPLEVGDIFQVSNTNKWYVLLSQPCDLMIRETGDRKNVVASLIRISRKEKSDIDKLKSTKPDMLVGFWKTHAELGYFFDSAKYLAIVSFEDELKVSLDMLDLAVLNKSGKCAININEISDIPYYLTDGWHQRLVSLTQHYKSIHDSLIEYEKGLAGVSEDLKPIFWKALMPIVTLAQSPLPETPYKAGCFDFQLTRVARYRQPWASRLLSLYSSYLSRDADDVDFVKFST